MWFIDVGQRVVELDVLMGLKWVIICEVYLNQREMINW